MSSQHGMGWRGPSLPGAYHFLYAPHPVVTPDAVDLTPTMPAILDQGKLGSCVFNATATAALCAEMAKGDLAAAAFEPSRLFMYYNARKAWDAVTQDTGSDYATAMEACTQFGIADERLWPYDPANFAVEPPPEVYAAAKREVVHIQFAVPQTQNAFESCIAEGFPLMIGVTLYESFESQATATTGIVVMPRARDKRVGGHAMLAVGYDRRKGLFKIRNSWGFDWGVQGYSWFPYEYLLSPRLGDDFRTIRAM